MIALIHYNPREEGLDYPVLFCSSKIGFYETIMNQEEMKDLQEISCMRRIFLLDIQEASPAWLEEQLLTITDKNKNFVIFQVSSQETKVPSLELPHSVIICSEYGYSTSHRIRALILAVLKKYEGGQNETVVPWQEYFANPSLLLSNGVVAVGNELVHRLKEDTVSSDAREWNSNEKDIVFRTIPRLVDNILLSLFEKGITEKEKAFARFVWAEWLKKRKEIFRGSRESLKKFRNNIKNYEYFFREEDAPCCFLLHFDSTFNFLREEESISYKIRLSNIQKKVLGYGEEIRPFNSPKKDFYLPLGIWEDFIEEISQAHKAILFIHASDLLSCGQVQQSKLSQIESCFEVTEVKAVCFYFNETSGHNRDNFRGQVFEYVSSNNKERYYFFLLPVEVKKEKRLREIKC